ncbi:peptide/nickel transport system permease protein [Pacificibacter maritimus]|uniref:Peptide/nickel transport system permease protein n=1 Tax=Pacificibacter maritimus TaxID=762213 RepID=A0A3N4UA39_9RHOB|nr:ABC transporter permease [Pacificibacter maritimus]RPE66638.1 peptide/nickel transport system permease protein [Pacificibacter maritimus]
MTASYLVRRLGHAFLVIFVVSLIAFQLGEVIGDPVTAILGLEAPESARVELREELGLDAPYVVRYAAYIADAFTGDFGMSYKAQRPVADVIVERVPATFELAMVALIISLSVGIPLGVVAAIWRETWWASALMTVSIIGVSLPTFVIGILLIFAFSVNLGWLPSFGRGDTVMIGGWSTGLLTPSGLAALIMPAISLAISQVALVARLVRAEMLEVLRMDYIRFARARGIKDRVVHFRHALRNTLLPIITVSGIQIGYLIAFAVVVEQVFQWPGLGTMFLSALTESDIPVITAFLVLIACVFATINLIVDLLYAMADPRVRLSKG